MKAIKLLLWTLAFLAVADVSLNLLTRYPDDPSGEGEIGTLQRYFNYGRSTESKIRWMTADNDARASPLAQAGWLIRPQERRTQPAVGSEELVAIYGMSFSANVGQQLEQLDRRFSVRLSGGPGATLSRTYAEYLLDRGQHEASIVVLGILASSVPVMGSVTHMTWNFEGPGSHFYPKFSAEGSRLVRVDPPANSLQEFRLILNDETKWAEAVEFIGEHDPYFDKWSFEADVLDHSTLGRLARRAWAQSAYRRTASRYHGAAGFTNHAQNIDVMHLIIESFASQVRRDGQLPLVILFNDRRYSDHLYQAVHRRMDELSIPYLSSHEVIRAEELEKFQRDGHFKPEYDRAIAVRLIGLIDTLRPRPASDEVKN